MAHHAARPSSLHSYEQETDLQGEVEQLGGVTDVAEKATLRPKCPRAASISAKESTVNGKRIRSNKCALNAARQSDRVRCA